MSYDAVVLDNDGVLVTPTDTAVLRRAIADALREHGVDDPAEEHVDALYSCGVDDIRTVAGAYDLDPRSLWAARERNAIHAQRREIAAGTKARYDDVDALDALDVPLGVVSNNQHETVEFVVDHLGLGDRFATVYGREPTTRGVRRKKPNTHYLERAVDDVGAEDPLYVGDSAVDVEVAHRLGLDSAFVRRDHRAGYDLSREPTHEIPDLRALPGLLG